MQNDSRIKDAPSGQVPIQDSRFGTHDIRLSSALCALGFSLRVDAQPVTITIDADKEKRIVTFFHQSTTKLGDFEAHRVELWWNSEPGKFSIVGYDDALTAMRRVHVERANLIKFSKSPPKYQPSRNTVIATRSLHTASVLAACEIKLVGYSQNGSQWIFAKGAEVIMDLIKAGGRPKERPLSNDLCVDWMLEALKYRDFLAKLVRDPDCIPTIEMRDGERVLVISSGMDERQQREWISRL